MTAEEHPIAVVTGANSGFGYATALHMARNGFHVAAGVRTPSRAAKLVEAASGLPLTVVQLDVTSDASVEAAFALTAELGPVEVLVNNAGVSASGPFELTSDAENRLIFETNYFGPLRCIRTVLPGMRDRKRGSIINVTSLSALFAWPNQACYAASKWALEGFGLALAHEVRRFGIRVVNVEPGAIRTEIVENTAERNHFDRRSPYIDVMRRNSKLIAAGFRAGATPQDVAAAVLDAIVSPEHRVQRPVGDDAKAIHERRMMASIDEFVALGDDDVTDDDHQGWFAANFGLQL